MIYAMARNFFCRSHIWTVWKPLTKTEFFRGQINLLILYFKLVAHKQSKNVTDFVVFGINCEIPAYNYQINSAKTNEMRDNKKTKYTARIMALLRFMSLCQYIANKQASIKHILSYISSRRQINLYIVHNTRSPLSTQHHTELSIICIYIFSSAPD